MSNAPQDWLGEAALRLDDARALLDRRSRNSRAISAAYYVVHAAGKGALLTVDTETNSHAAVVRLLSYHFVRPGRLPDDTASLIQDLHRKRLAADYDLEPRSAGEARARLDGAETLIERLATLA